MKLTSIFSGNCADPSATKGLSLGFGAICLACVLLCVLLQNSPVLVLAQEPATSGPTQTVAQDSTAPSAATGPERIDIRIELPIVEPLFDIFYAREEPRIEPDVITPVTNPLHKLPPASKPEGQEKLQAKRLVKPQMLLDQLRE